MGLDCLSKTASGGSSGGGGELIENPCEKWCRETEVIQYDKWYVCAVLNPEFRVNRLTNKDIEEYAVKYTREAFIDLRNFVTPMLIGFAVGLIFGLIIAYMHLCCAKSLTKERGRHIRRGERKKMRRKRKGKKNKKSKKSKKESDDNSKSAKSGRSAKSARSASSAGSKM